MLWYVWATTVPANCRWCEAWYDAQTHHLCLRRCNARADRWRRDPEVRRSDGGTQLAATGDRTASGGELRWNCRYPGAVRRVVRRSGQGLAASALHELPSGGRAAASDGFEAAASTPGRAGQ